MAEEDDEIVPGRTIVSDESVPVATSRASSAALPLQGTALSPGERGAPASSIAGTLPSPEGTGPTSQESLAFLSTRNGLSSNVSLASKSALENLCCLH